LDTRYPVGIRIGDCSLLQFSIQDFTVGTTNFFYFWANGGGLRYHANAWSDPTLLTYRRISNNPDHSGEALLPIVVYRRQVANAAFPVVSGSLVQVSPLIERIPYSLYINADITAVTIPDLLIAAGVESSVADSPDFNLQTKLYVRDLQPVMVGATYHYYVMRMNDKHEVAEIIDAGTVTIPAN
jgi:hypothetical protein